MSCGVRGHQLATVPLQAGSFVTLGFHSYFISNTVLARGYSTPKSLQSQFLQKKEGPKQRTLVCGASSHTLCRLQTYLLH